MEEFLGVAEELLGSGFFFVFFLSSAEWELTYDLFAILRLFSLI